MLPKYHILFGFLFSLILYLIFPFIDLFGFFIIFFSSFLIDFDRYVYYVFAKKDLSLRNAYSFFLGKPKLNPAMYLLHGIEVLLALFIIGIFVNEIFLFIFIGFSFHLFLDVLEMVYYGIRVVKVSLMYDFIRQRKI